ncbi:MAG: protein kinase [Actinomycetota bacterium]|nr:protein kinase [Actinomycetota bacterium]
MSRLGGRFVLEREIGSGGMASVYLGTDEVLERRVAVKVLKPEFQESYVGSRFRREGRTAARLSHPNIVRVYDAGEDELDGRRVSYIVMEHVSGGDLREMIAERGRLPVEEISRLSGIAAGLAHAHERGIVHRDIKPHNILLDENGQPKLTDFGIARALDATQITRTGMYLGTARYSSPEQLQGGETTAKSDVYSLGATLYEAATSGPPFAGTPIEVATQHVAKPPTPPGELAPTDERLEALILECLAKDPDDRPTAAAVERRLKELDRATGSTRPRAATGVARSADATPTGATRADPAREESRADNRGVGGAPRWVPAAVVLAAVLVLVGALGAYAMLGGEDRSAQAPATTGQAPAPQTVDEPAPSGLTAGRPSSGETRRQIRRSRGRRRARPRRRHGPPGRSTDWRPRATTGAPTSFSPRTSSSARRPRRPSGADSSTPWSGSASWRGRTCRSRATRHGSAA